MSKFNEQETCKKIIIPITHLRLVVECLYSYFVSMSLNY